MSGDFVPIDGAGVTKKVAIIQSNYIPWKGYFDAINKVDEFILFDDVQFTRRDWRNRNIIKSPQGPLWLTIPVSVKGKYHQKIKDTLITGTDWSQKHWQTIKQCYARAPYFKDYHDVFEELYLGANETSLSPVNHRFLEAICQLLGIQSRITWSMDYALADGKTERLISLCQQAGATEYVSGPAARVYIQEELFAEAGIALSYMEYSGYPEYSQLYPPFEHAVSVIDLIFNTGKAATSYMLSFP